MLRVIVYSMPAGTGGSQLRLVDKDLIFAAIRLKNDFKH